MHVGGGGYANIMWNKSNDTDITSEKVQQNAVEMETGENDGFGRVCGGGPGMTVFKGLDTLLNECFTSVVVPISSSVYILFYFYYEM